MKAKNTGGGLFPAFDFDAGSAQHLTAKAIPYFGPGDDGKKWEAFKLSL